MSDTIAVIKCQAACGRTLDSTTLGGFTIEYCHHSYPIMGDMPHHSSNIHYTYHIYGEKLYEIIPPIKSPYSGKTRDRRDKNARWMILVKQGIDITMYTLITIYKIWIETGGNIDQVNMGTVTSTILMLILLTLLTRPDKRIIR
jgi:hypothetical protein